MTIKILEVGPVTITSRRSKNQKWSKKNAEYLVILRGVCLNGECRNPINRKHRGQNNTYCSEDCITDLKFKWCSAHEEVHPTSEFIVDPSAPDGLRGRCRNIRNTRQRERFATDPEYRQRHQENTRRGLKALLERNPNYFNDRPSLKERDPEAYQQMLADKRLKYRTNEEYREKRLEAMRRTNAKYPDRRRERRVADKAKRRGASVEGVSLTLLAENWDGTCCLCGLDIPDVQYPHPAYINVEHLLPIARGGTHTQENVAYAHSYCNQSKNDKTMQEWEEYKEQTGFYIFIEDLLQLDTSINPN